MMQHTSTDHVPTRGKLIVFEGIDGSGKSTQIQMLAEFLRAQGKEVVISFEPTKGPWGMRVRDAAMSGERLSVCDEMDCLLQDRREHVRDLIWPELERGSWVLLDRYYLSTMAYQGASGANVEEIRDLNEAFAPIPDLAIWLDISLDVSHQRRLSRGLLKDAFEDEEFLARVAHVYAEMQMPWLHRINADEPAGEVQEMIRALLMQEL